LIGRAYNVISYNTIIYTKTFQTMPGFEKGLKDQAISSAKRGPSSLAVDVLRLQESLEKALAQDQSKKTRGKLS